MLRLKIRNKQQVTAKVSQDAELHLRIGSYQHRPTDQTPVSSILG